MPEETTLDLVNQRIGLLLAQFETRAHLIQDEIDRRFDAILELHRHDMSAVQLQLDQRFDHDAEAFTLQQDQIDRRLGALQVQMDHRLSILAEQSEQRFAAEAKARETAQATSVAAIQAALKSAETAVSKSEVSVEKRFEGVNEFRKTLSDQTAGFMTRDEVNVRVTAIEAAIGRVDGLIRDIELRFTSRLDTTQAHLAGQDDYRNDKRLDIGVVIQLVAFFVVTAGVLFAILKG